MGFDGSWLLGCSIARWLSMVFGFGFVILVG